MGGPNTTFRLAGEVLANQGAFSLRSQFDSQVPGWVVRASPSLRPHPSEELRLLEFSIRTDPETSSRRLGWSGSEAGRRLR